MKRRKKAAKLQEKNALIYEWQQALQYAPFAKGRRKKGSGLRPLITFLKCAPCVNADQECDHNRSYDKCENKGIKQNCVYSETKMVST